MTELISISLGLISIDRGNVNVSRKRTTHRTGYGRSDDLTVRYLTNLHRDCLLGSWCRSSLVGRSCSPPNYLKSAIWRDEPSGHSCRSRWGQRKNKADRHAACKGLRRTSWGDSVVSEPFDERTRTGRSRFMRMAGGRCARISGFFGLHADNSVVL